MSFIAIREGESGYESEKFHFPLLLPSVPLCLCVRQIHTFNQQRRKLLFKLTLPGAPGHREKNKERFSRSYLEFLHIGLTQASQNNLNWHISLNWTLILISIVL
jgi:hypothetical protein